MLRWCDMISESIPARPYTIMQRPQCSYIGSLLGHHESEVVNRHQSWWSDLGGYHWFALSLSLFLALLVFYLYILVGWAFPRSIPSRSMSYIFIFFFPFCLDATMWHSIAFFWSHFTYPKQALVWNFIKNMWLTMKAWREHKAGRAKITL